MSISTKTKYQAIVKTFGVPVDPDDVPFIIANRGGCVSLGILTPSSCGRLMRIVSIKAGAPTL